MNRISSILLRAALPAALLTACTTTVTDDIEAGEESVSRAINFGTPALSRSAIDNANDAAFNAFKVWGWNAPASGGTSAVEFDGEMVSRNSNLWTYEGQRYWQDGRTYNFYALYPNGMDNANYNSDGTLTVSDFDCSGTGDDAVDLMAAARTDMSGNAPEKVAFTFGHELARLRFTVTSEGDPLTVTSALIYGFPYKGTLSKTADVSTWNDLTSASENDTPFRLTDVQLTSDALSSSLWGDVLLIPSEPIDNALTYRYDGDTETHTAEIPLKTADVTAWVKNQSYSYTVNIPQNSVDVTLTVTVANWEIRDANVEW